MVKTVPWYRQYAALKQRVEHLKTQFTKRCEALGADPNVIADQIWQEQVIRAVHESNWQEGIYVEQGKTRELALHVFDNLEGVVGPHLDFDGLTESHRRRVVTLKRKGMSIDEIATVNLSAAHIAIKWIATELMSRQTASLAFALKQFQDMLPSIKERIPEARRATIETGFKTLEKLLRSSAEVHTPITGGVATTGLLYQHLLHVDFHDLLHPMRVDYIHFLHRILLMGVADARGCGRFRKGPVHVGNPDLVFPSAGLISGMMAEFCKEFPTILPATVKYDPILRSAKVSHQFVRIHPYHDGNGRVSRLLMNLVLWGFHPPVYLKADKIGRHKYGQALRRADRGNVEPLACLIASNLVRTYERLIESTGERPTRPPTVQ
jgi:fido (protein-threonine AMPylation protein)